METLRVCKPGCKMLKGPWDKLKTGHHRSVISSESITFLPISRCICISFLHSQSVCFFFLIFRGRFFHDGVWFFSSFKLAGDKSEQDAKLRRMADEIERLKDKLGRQENLEDEVLQIVKTYAKLHWPPLKELWWSYYHHLLYYWFHGFFFLGGCIGFSYPTEKALTWSPFFFHFSLSLKMRKQNMRKRWEALRDK